jgi:small GTP-binding protein
MLPLQDCCYSLYILVAGDAGVGKSTLAHHARRGDWPGDKQPTTIGIDFVAVHRELALNSEEDYRILGRREADVVSLQIQLLDVPGDRRKAPIVRSYYIKAQGFLLVYDVTRRDTFLALRTYWWPEIQEHARNFATVTVIGNKTDLPVAQHAVSEDEARQFARDIGASALYLCSAHRSAYETIISPIDTTALAIVRAIRRDVADRAAGRKGPHALAFEASRRGAQGPQGVITLSAEARAASRAGSNAQGCSC